jgi:hypothetical protein
MFENIHTNALTSRRGRQAAKAIARHTGAVDRKMAAEHKRERRAAKRLRDAQASALGQIKAREALEAGALRVYRPIVDGAVA